MKKTIIIFVVIIGLFAIYRVFNLFFRNDLVNFVYQKHPCGKRISDPSLDKTVCQCAGIKIDELQKGMTRTVCLGKCHSCETVRGEGF